MNDHINCFPGYICHMMEKKKIRTVRFFTADKALYETALSIRKKVFIDEQSVDPALEFENEEESVYYLVYFNEVPAGTGRWRRTPGGIKLERFAVLEEYRKRGVGTVLLNDLLREIIPLKTRIYLHSQLAAVSYYERAGFEKKGEIFEEADIDHYLMEYSRKGQL